MHRGKYGDDFGEQGPVYRAIERGLWALAPGLILLLALTYPSMKAARQDAATRMDITIAAENAEYCVKWGMAAGTPEHLDCIRDLVAIRARSGQRVRDEVASDF